MLGGISVHTEYRCLFLLYEFLKYRNTGVCRLNNVRNVTLFERGPQCCTLLRTPLYVNKHESSETEAVERDYTEELIHTISTLTATNTHCPLPSAPASHPHKLDFSTIFSNFQTHLMAFFHRIYILTNLATFLDKL